jgi:hypothetical protein
MVVNNHSQCLEIPQADESARCRCCNRATYKGGTIARIGIYWGSSLSSSAVEFGVTSNRYFLFVVFILFFLSLICIVMSLFVTPARLIKSVEKKTSTMFGLLSNFHFHFPDIRLNRRDAYSTHGNAGKQERDIVLCDCDSHEP